MELGKGFEVLMGIIPNDEPGARGDSIQGAKGFQALSSFRAPPKASVTPRS